MSGSKINHYDEDNPILEIPKDGDQDDVYKLKYAQAMLKLALNGVYGGCTSRTHKCRHTDHCTHGIVPD